MCCLDKHVDDKRERYNGNHAPYYLEQNGGLPGQLMILKIGKGDFLHGAVARGYGLVLLNLVFSC